MVLRTRRLRDTVLALALVASVFIPFALRQTPVRSAESVERTTVYVASMKGAVEPGLASYVRRALREAADARASAILFEVDTFGGRVDAATEIRDLVLDASVPSVAFVKGRAWSAGALVTLAAERIAMAPGASIGAAETVPKSEKEISAFRGEFEATAQARGRDPEVAAAMVDSDVAISGLVDAGKLLTLTAREAMEIGFIDFVAATRAEVLEKCGLAEALVVEVPQNWAERVARFLTEPTVSSILLVIGFLGLLFEVTTPGWGVPGTSGVVALALFFGGRMIAGLAGWEVVGLFILGFVLLLAEVFLIPGFGVAGISGLAAIFASLVLSFRDLREAGLVLSFSLVVSAFVAAVAARYLGGPRGVGRLVLRAREDRREGYTAAQDRRAFVGRVGTALTAMRPSGTILVDGVRLDAVSEGDYVEKGDVIQVVGAEGPRLVVRLHEARASGPRGER